MNCIFKIVACIAVFMSSAFAAAWTGSAVEPENMKKIDGKAFYVITSAEELAWFANQVNSGKTTINAVLANDIVFGANTSTICSKAWTPIGKDSSHIFNGIIDGGLHSIYGLYINDAKFAGLVGIMGANGMVKKATLTVGNIKATNTSNFIGGFVAINSGKIDSVVNKNSISTSGQNGAGIVGWNANSALISNARNEATLSFNGMGGGIASKNDGSILNSINKGNVSISVSHTCFASNASYTYYLGGIVGENNGSLAYVINEGSISATSKATGCFRSSVGKWYSTTVNTYQGGIAGINRAKAKSSKSSNSGTLSYSGTNGQAGNTSGGGGYANGIVGGVAGRNEGQIDNSCNFDSRNIVGETSGKIINSFSVGKATYWANNVSKAYTTENMKKNQFAWVLNTTDGTTSNSGIWSRNDGYPTFANNSYKAIYKVVFDDDGTTSNRYTNYKGQVSFPEDPEPAEGYIFSGWYNSDDTKVKSTTVFTADQTVKAIYSDASDIFWTITFYNAAPADTVLESKSYQHGSIVTYGGETPTLTATAKYTYTFKGWDVEPTNAVEDFEYHAVYDSTIRSYTVTFNNADGFKIESGTYEYGKMPSCSETPTRVATAEWKYSHKGWKPALDYVTEAATYTAIYDSSKVEYKVTFMNGVTVIEEQMVPYGDAAVAPTDVTREGYKFVGWNTSFAKVTEALTVKALFEELIIRSVNVVDGDGDKIVNATVEDGEKYTLPEAPKKDGYTFDAYYDGNKKIGVAGDEISVTANITIIAKYIENPKSSSSSVVSSSSEEIVTSSSSSAKSSSSSSKTISSSSNAKSSSSVVKSSSSSAPKSSSSSVKSSSSSKAKSSSSKKSDAIVVTRIPQFSIQVIAHNIQISKARIGSSYVLFDMQGKVLLQGQVYTTNFNMSVARPGNYLLKIDNRIQRVVIK